MCKFDGDRSERGEEVLEDEVREVIVLGICGCYGFFVIFGFLYLFFVLISGCW